jgi:hypothetical protein
MKPTLTALALIATFIIAGCSRNGDIGPVAQVILPSAQAGEQTLPLYPALQADAKDGTVFDYY